MVCIYRWYQKENINKRDRTRKEKLMNCKRMEVTLQLTQINSRTSNLVVYHSYLLLLMR